jgi:hypothetical protein
MIHVLYYMIHVLYYMIHVCFNHLKSIYVNMKIFNVYYEILVSVIRFAAVDLNMQQGIKG